MPAPKHPPEVRQKAAEVYARTNSYSEAARQAGVHEASVRLWLKEVPKPHEVNARAVEEGLRRGCEVLQNAIEKGQAMLDAAETPDAYSKTCSGIARATEALNSIGERPARQLQARLTRDKTRAETERIRKGIPPEDSDPSRPNGASPTSTGSLLERIGNLAAQADAELEPEEESQGPSPAHTRRN